MRFQAWSLGKSENKTNWQISTNWLHHDSGNHWKWWHSIVNTSLLTCVSLQEPVTNQTSAYLKQLMLERLAKRVPSLIEKGLTTNRPSLSLNLVFFSSFFLLLSLLLSGSFLKAPLSGWHQLARGRHWTFIQRPRKKTFFRILLRSWFFFGLPASRWRKVIHVLQLPQIWAKWNWEGEHTNVTRS